jgi:hypothetical protein
MSHNPADQSHDLTAPWIHCRADALSATVFEIHCNGNLINVLAADEVEAQSVARLYSESERMNNSTGEVPLL